MRTHRGFGLIDVIMPVLDRPSETALTLESLYEQNDNIRVIVVDNGSYKLDYLDQYPDVTLIKNETNQGAIKAFNQGLEIATSDYIVVMHNDILVARKNWIKAAADKMECDSNIGMVGIAGWEKIDAWGEYCSDTTVSALNELRYDAFQKTSGEVAVSDGCCNVIRNIGLRFDERYGLFHLYDLDLSMQYRAKEYTIHIMEVAAVHLATVRQYSSMNSKKYLRQTGKSDLLYGMERQLMFEEKWKNQLPINVGAE